MLALPLSLLLIPALASSAAAAEGCPDPSLTSCSSSASSADACCVLNPGGLVLFSQRFEPDVGGDMGSWGIDTLEVIDCKTNEPLAKPYYAKAYSHEEIGSFCLRDPLFGGEQGFERAEADWAQSEVGEGVEELWERSWSSAGRYVSTLAPECMIGKPRGVEVPMYFLALQRLHHSLPTAKLLADADITPSADTTYSLSELVAALAFNDHKPMIPPSTTVHAPTPTPKWDPLHRPQPRPITLSHDESRLYDYGAQDDVAGGRHAGKGSVKKLGFFKQADEEREKGDDGSDKQYVRDEL
ncbi:hypothetical protein EHS25_003254 [Saitozyma podzolica]|uniref:Uncharacterized protein n=1 Tax=Saitozyma podzolica TaxID=1890683 RepID=A0A427Y8F9_9TREE|nr:hypothetical protein EHS25_003254 [Saitozyma podzolica]